MIRRLRSALALLAVCLAAAPLSAQERRETFPFRAYGTPASRGDGAAIDALITGYKDAWARQDTAALIALHAQDTEWINAYARMFQGAAPLADFLQHRLFPDFPAEVSQQEAANMRTMSIRYLGGDAAVVHLYTEGNRGASRNSGEEVRRTHLHLVLGKEGKDWKVAHTAIMDAR
jgi:uncharacterized protein (TIGR02246 family)